MAGLSATQANAILNQLLRGVAATVPTLPVKVSLHTADPGAAGTTAEVTGGSYARQSVTIGAATSGQSANSADVTFAGMPAVTVTHIALWDSNAGGAVFLWSGALTVSKAVSAGDTFTLPASDVTAALTVAA